MVPLRCTIAAYKIARSPWIHLRSFISFLQLQRSINCIRKAFLPPPWPRSDPPTHLFFCPVSIEANSACWFGKFRQFVKVRCSAHRFHCRLHSFIGTWCHFPPSLPPPRPSQIQFIKAAASAFHLSIMNSPIETDWNPQRNQFIKDHPIHWLHLEMGLLHQLIIVSCYAITNDFQSWPYQYSSSILFDPFQSSTILSDPVNGWNGRVLMDGPFPSNKESGGGYWGWIKAPNCPNVSEV